MNYSKGTLHVVGSAEAVDKHQDNIIEHTLRELYKTDRYISRCANDFTPDFLFEVEAVAVMMAATPVFIRL